jgi:putative endonuclease
LAPEAVRHALAWLRDRLARLRKRARPGQSGEALACRFLERSGYRVVDRNFRCRSGEVDVIARRGAQTVFVEVKERRGASHGAGVDAVTFGKRRRIVRAARLYAASRGLDDAPIRFDVIAIDWTRGRPRVRHYLGAFRADG